MLVVKTINAWLHTELPELTCSDTAFIRFHHKPRTLHKHPRPQPLPEAYTHRRDHKQIYCHTDCKARQAAPNQFPTTAAHRAVLVRCHGAASRSKQQGQTPTARGGITRRRIASSRCSNCSTCRQKIMSLASSPDQTQHSPNATRPTLTHSLAHQPAPRAIITFCKGLYYWNSRHEGGFNKIQWADKRTILVRPDKRRPRFIYIDRYVALLEKGTVQVQAGSGSGSFQSVFHHLDCLI